MSELDIEIDPEDLSSDLKEMIRCEEGAPIQAYFLSKLVFPSSVETLDSSQDETIGIHSSQDEMDERQSLPIQLDQQTKLYVGGLFLSIALRSLNGVIVDGFDSNFFTNEVRASFSNGQNLLLGIYSNLGYFFIQTMGSFD